MLNYKVKPRYKLYKFGDTEYIVLWRIKKPQDILVINKKKK